MKKVTYKEFFEKMLENGEQIFVLYDHPQYAEIPNKDIIRVGNDLAHIEIYLNKDENEYDPSYSFFYKKSRIF